jgi:hypothetical protein
MGSSEDRLAEQEVERGPFERFAERASQLVSEDLKAAVGLQHRR